MKIAPLLVPLLLILVTMEVNSRKTVQRSPARGRSQAQGKKNIRVHHFTFVLKLGGFPMIIVLASHKSVQSKMHSVDKREF